MANQNHCSFLTNVSSILVAIFLFGCASTAETEPAVLALADSTPDSGDPQVIKYLDRIYPLPGLEVTFQSGNNQYPADWRAIELRFHLNKCSKDSRSFARLLGLVANYAQSPGGRKLKIHAKWIHDTFLLLPIALDEFTLDLNQLHKFPDPIKDQSTGKFEVIPGTPSWAETICAFLAHEIAEHLKQMQRGSRDRQADHYNFANPESDKIVADYYGITRTRGEDCRKLHDAHVDVIIEIKPQGLIIMHLARPIVNFERWGDVIGTIDVGQITHITYNAGGNFPGRGTGTDCR